MITLTFQNCTAQSNTSMLCHSPKINIPKDIEIDAEHPKNLEFGFKMDNVSRVQNLSAQQHVFFLLYPNPVYEPFDEEIKYYKSDYLTINVSF